ncbi:MAG: T9SS type A sorting domain-containing protein [Bacteroidales bacterium]|nr:T9SS type A sorting domain-containing protein [Bacteroidales bacterium]
MPEMKHFQFRFIFLWVVIFNSLNVIGQDYIHEVQSYTPAPGQMINTTVGRPEALQSVIGGINGLVTLGAFGGEIVFSFSGPVENHPDNPYGIDFIIFGNPLPDWSEPGVVWVMKDENNNGLPDDQWYQLAGSDYYFSSTRKNYQVSYSNPGGQSAEDVPWVDNLGNQGFINANDFNAQPYYPMVEYFPNINQQSYTLGGTFLEHPLDSSQAYSVKAYERAFGYADNKKRGTPPYHIPDNPYTRIVENGGGDGFDISWAVDAQGAYVEMDRVHFIKVQSSMLKNAGWLGEISTDIAGAVKVQPDVSLTGELEMVVFSELPRILDICECQLEVFSFNKGIKQDDRTILWEVDQDWAGIDNDNRLILEADGQLTIKAYLADKPEVSWSQQITVAGDCQPLNLTSDYVAVKHIYPNPFNDKIIINTDKDSEINVYGMNGISLYSGFTPAGECQIDLGFLRPGVYVLFIGGGQQHQGYKIVKQ